MNRLAIFGGKPIRNKPFPAWPVFDKTEEDALLDVLRSGKWWRYAYSEASGQAGVPQSKVAEFERAFARHQGAKHGIACANGTAALEVSLKASGVGPGDEVIVPAYTFVATATSVLNVNAVPIFADISGATFNLDPTSVERAISSRAKAIIPVHFAGLAADMDALLEIAKRRNLLVIEDAAHAHGAAWKDQGLGSVGHAGTFSFQASKNMTAGEGGLILTSDEECATLCESFASLGRKTGAPWYEHHRLGWNYRMTEFQGALLLQQLARLEAQNSRRRENASHLTTLLSQIPGIQTLQIPEYVTRHSYHLYIFRLKESEFGVSRASFLDALEKEGIPCTGGYAHPLYRNPMFLNRDFYNHGCPLTCGHYDSSVDFSAFEALCPNAERACREAVWFEHRLLLAEREDMEDIARAISKVYECRNEFAESSAPVNG
ncbi:MAG: DegT/DnrJ/EryC1/StrS family aminotransferase [Terriglobia bacterium]